MNGNSLTIWAIVFPHLGANLHGRVHFVISREALKQQRSKRKALQILIEDISRKEEGSTLVTCQLQSGKATVTFTFNSNVDSPEDICENLVSPFQTGN